MGIFRSFAGTVRVELTSANPAAAINSVIGTGVDLLGAERTGDFTVEIVLPRKNYRNVVMIAEKRGEKLRLIQRKGLYWAGKRAVRRPVLVVGMVLLLWLAVFLPTRVLFVRVEGNKTVPEQLILERAEEWGVGFGASRQRVRSERVKNGLLGEIPELQWIGVNTKGCVAVISVRERTAEEAVEERSGVSSLVADRDAVIREVTVLRGNGLCKVGQAVREGEVLISGYTDCGLSIQATRAQGEVFGETQREIVAVIPEIRLEKGDVTEVKKKYGLRIGKKQINFYKGSGILGVSCDKMYSESILTLPGGFELPVALIQEEWIYRKAQTAQVPEEVAKRCLVEVTRHYLQERMVAGRILHSRELVEGNHLYGEYACLEMIARQQSEEIMQSYGKSD